MSKNREKLIKTEPKKLMFKLCIPAIVGMVVNRFVFIYGWSFCWATNRD